MVVFTQSPAVLFRDGHDAGVANARPGRLGEGLLQDSLHETFPDAELSSDTGRALAARADAVDAQTRGHGAPLPRRRFHARPRDQLGPEP